MPKYHTSIEIVDSVITITSRDLVSTIDLKEMEALAEEKEVNSFLAKNFLGALINHPLSPTMKRALWSLVSNESTTMENDNESSN